jgi:hypothetical protein
MAVTNLDRFERRQFLPPSQVTHFMRTPPVLTGPTRHEMPLDQRQKILMDGVNVPWKTARDNVAPYTRSSL